jgi:hypothetical protein
MELYEMELMEAARRLVANGRNSNDFVFNRSYLPPDPDGAGMFTVQYEVTISNLRTSKSIVVIGGIGLQWVDQLVGALKAGKLD